MLIAELVAAAQTTVPEAGAGSNSISAGYWVIALVAVVLGLVVMVYVRTAARRSSKSQT